MPLSGTPAPPNKRKKPSKIITDLSHITQDEYDSEPEASEFDLGKKIRAPKDIMLEELSLMKNKGSKMFRMRQIRVERFIYENNPDLFSSESMDNLQKFVPSLGGQMMDIGGHLIDGQMASQAGGAGQAPVPPPKPGSYGKGVGVGLVAGGLTGGAAGAAGAGAGAGVKDGVSENASQSGESANAASLKAKKGSEYVKTYTSPWERAMKGNEDLLATMKSQMPGPCSSKELHKYKSFNRSAIPYGGFEKASQLMTFQLPDIEVATEEPEQAVVYQHDISSRPSFNRTPIGWGGSTEPGSIHMELDTIPFDGETDDL
ncbi:myozenin-1-like isoform X2 [Myxocyprinus asiaticus]|nr:myozenin-1-like isoform X2 [Myxocyprinus asiaticus]XP_051507684.1 myozenin-1-like isoform X2 [Myxocyprinus asiaticus]